MSQLTPISKQHHAEKSWKRFTTYTFAAKDNLVPLVAAETPKAVSSLPMAFARHQDRFLLVAVLSLIQGTNLFVSPTGQWLGRYVPSAFRGYPFRLAKAEGQDDLILCVDEDSGLVSENNDAGEPFFDGDGEIAQSVKGVLDFLNQVERNRMVTETAVTSLAEAGLITEWPLKIKDQEQEKPVTGLYRIDETKLNALGDDQFLKLRKAQALPIAYAQLLSMGNIQVFAQLAKARAQMNQMDQAKSVPQVPDIQPMLGDDDMISFQ
jgi:hypothetical protein